MKRTSIFRLLSGSLILFCSGFLVAEAKESESEIIRGVVATGTNRILGSPVRDFGTVLGVDVGTFGFPTVAAYNPDGGEPIPLTAYTEESAILATIIDPTLVGFLGVDPDTIDTSLVNVPLHKVKTLVSGDNVRRGELPGIFDSVPFSLSNAAPSTPITLADWMKARGYAWVHCRHDGNSSIRLSMKKLVPNRVYTVWGSAVSVELGRPFGYALGGLPNTFVTDGEGKGKFNRELNHCPLQTVEEVQTLDMWIAVVLHSDHMVYGGVFSPNGAGFFPGAVTHNHLLFPFFGEEE